MVEPRKITVNIFGQSEHGKDTLGDWIAWKLVRRGYPLLRTSYAEEIKKLAMAWTGMPREVAFGDQETRSKWKYQGMTAREWQRKIGDWGREICPDFWITKWSDKIAKHFEEGQGAAVSSDGRMEREWRLCHNYIPGIDHDYYDVLVRRPGHVAESSDPNHPTEAEVAKMHGEDFEFYVETNDADALYYEAERIVRAIIGEDPE